MERRAKVLTSAGAAVVVLAVIALALLSRPTVPYRFLADSKPDATVIEEHWDGSGRKVSIRYYWVTGPYANLSVQADQELIESQGWTKVSDSTEGVGHRYTRDGLEQVVLTAEPGGTWVTLWREPTLADRIQAWKWHRTQRD